jgi:stage V sporulation protein G
MGYKDPYSLDKGFFSKNLNNSLEIRGGYLYMQVTEVRVFPVNEEKLKAYVTITFDDSFVVRDLKIIKGSNGLFVAMPSKKRKDGTFKDTAHPLNNETRQMIETKVLAEYEKELAKQASQPSDESSRGERPFAPADVD